MRTSTTGLVIILSLYAAVVVYIDQATTHEVYGCSEQNLPTEIKKYCDAKLFRTKYTSTSTSKRSLQRTQQKQSSEDSGIISGVIQDRRGIEMDGSKNL